MAQDSFVVDHRRMLEQERRNDLIRQIRAIERVPKLKAKVGVIADALWAQIWMFCPEVVGALFFPSSY